MSCSAITAGFLDLCNDGTAGIEKIFIGNGPVESITETAGVITAITVGGSAMTPSDFFVFETPRQTKFNYRNYNSFSRERYVIL